MLILTTLFPTLIWVPSCSVPSSAGVILQLRHDPGDVAHFPWSWPFIKERLGDIKAAGYTAILISPHQRSCGYSVGYNPEDFTDFNSSHGTEKELETLIKAFHSAGMQIYADMVLNHMCKDHQFKYDHFSPDVSPENDGNSELE